MFIETKPLCIYLIAIGAVFCVVAVYAHSFHPKIRTRLIEKHILFNGTKTTATVVDHQIEHGGIFEDEYRVILKTEEEIPQKIFYFKCFGKNEKPVLDTKWIVYYDANSGYCVVAATFD